MNEIIDVMICGHICIDLIPKFLTGSDTVSELLAPGKLVNIGEMISSTGGAVPNTGGALKKFGLNTVLVGNLGNDMLGSEIIQILTKRGTDTQHLKISYTDPTSYTIVINIPGIDRMPLHCPGANDAFSLDTIPWDLIASTRLFHFGYPPLMKSIYSDGGNLLSSILQKAKSEGVTTSLDMARPDPESEAGRVDWKSYLEKVLPLVDLFHPSIDELVYMIDREAFSEFDRQLQAGVPIGGLTQIDLDNYAQRLISMGVAIVIIKLGNCGLYAAVTSDQKRLSERYIGKGYFKNLIKCSGQTIYEPCYKAKVKGAIGAGDCTIAGFIAAFLKGYNLKDTCSSAVGAGSCNVEQPDALSGIPTWEKLQTRILTGWKKEKRYL